MAKMLQIYNCDMDDFKNMPCLDISEFRQSILEQVGQGMRIASFFALPADNGTCRLICLLADDANGNLYLLSTEVLKTYPALTTQCPQAHLFEREIAEQFSILPEGHPWLKPVRFHKSYNGNGKSNEVPQIGVTDFFKVEGGEIHEAAVGPVHAGIIEPGHFRFQCNGENVFHLEISLGYQHRGIEKAIRSGTQKRIIHYMETLAGDTTIGHTLAYSKIIETLSNCRVSARAHSIRAIAIELERLANHTGDLGALAGDIGYLPTASFCGRIRGDFLNMTAILCGNRFGRGLICPGGLNYDLENSQICELKQRLETALWEVSSAVNLLWESPSVLNRFDDTGTLTQQNCIELGIVGVPAKACGLARDVRFNFASGAYQFTQIPISTWDTGDVFARAYVRWLEIQKSIDFIKNELENLPNGQSYCLSAVLGKNKIAVSLVEGWRGEICHTAITDDDGKILHYKIVDPSFHNWMGLAMAMRNQQISDFPLCNKSFNLSYCGRDL
jgi:Ni,Fe-hydrogenase III large subunit